MPIEPSQAIQKSFAILYACHFIESGFISRSKFLRSDHEFNTFNFHARWFLPLSSTERPIRTALNTVVVSHHGNPPSQALAALGVRDILRRYFLARYCDRKLLAIQSELGALLGPKWSIVVYIALGNISDEWQGMFAREFKPPAGTGLHYRVVDAQKGNPRLDCAWGRETPNPSYYLSLA